MRVHQSLRVPGARRKRVAVALAVCALACCDASVSIDVGPGDGGAAGDPSVAFLAPTEGQSFARDGVDGHEWAADVMVTLAVSGVASVSLERASGQPFETLTAAPWETVLHLTGEGMRGLVARGLDAAGDEVARAEVSILVLPPSDASCHAMLDALGLEWEVASPAMGIADPVRVQPLIRGVAYRYASSDSPTAMLMDCTLAPRLVELSELLATYEIDEVVHLGIYNYRCIGGGDPASGTCTPSQHAYAKAIDLHAFGVAEGATLYDVETDWVITGGEVCPGAPANDEDRVLHEIACTLWSDRTFQIVLTPDYNADHRNHFHVDLTEGDMFIGETVSGVDPIVAGLGD